MWIWIRSVMTADVPVLFLSAAGVAGREYCVPGSIHWYVTSMTMSPRWSLAPPHNVIGKYWLLALA